MSPHIAWEGGSDHIGARRLQQIADGLAVDHVAKVTYM